MLLSVCKDIRGYLADPILCRNDREINITLSYLFCGEIHYSLLCLPDVFTIAKYTLSTVGVMRSFEIYDYTFADIYQGKKDE